MYFRKMDPVRMQGGGMAMFKKKDPGNVGNPENRKAAIGGTRSKRRNRKRIILFTSLLVALLLVVGIGSVIYFGSRGSASPENVTVTFDSTGGSEIASQTVVKGAKLAAVDAPIRNGYLFAGWYYEEAPVNAYTSEDLIAENTTLYAGWVEPQIEADFQEFIRNSDPNISFIVRSEVVLTDENLSEFVELSCVDYNDGTTISVQPEGDAYRLYAKEGFKQGLTYTIKILDTKTVFFEKAGDQAITDRSIRAYSFSISKENVNHVVKKAVPKLLSTDDMSGFEIIGTVAEGQTGITADNGKSIYRVSLVSGDETLYQVGDIVSVGNGQEDVASNQYYRVIEVGTTSAGSYMDVIDPNLEDIYSEMDLYYDGDAVYFEDESEKEIEEIRALERDIEVSVLKSKGYEFLSASIARGIKESPTVQSTVATLSPEYQKKFAEMKIADLADLLQNITVSVNVEKTYDISWKENGVRGAVEISAKNITIPLDPKVSLTISISLKNVITQTAYTAMQLYSEDDYAKERGVWVNNYCKVTFDAVISTSDGENQINITEEIQNLVNSVSENKTQDIVNNMNQENFFGDDLSYVEIFNKELGKKTVSIYQVLTIDFKLNFHVDIGMRVGLSLNFENTETRKIGVSELTMNGSKTVSTVNARIASRTHFSAVLKGQIGIRAGFKIEVNFSLVHLNSIFNIGFTVDIGVYEEISGFVRFDYDSVGGISFAGGLKSETGIYLSLQFSWNLFGWKDSVTIAEFKFPILTIGSLEFATEFEKAEEKITFNTLDYNAKNNGDQNLLKMKYIDIKSGANGVVLNIKPAPISTDYKFFVIKDQTGIGSKDDLGYIKIDASSGMIHVKEGAPERLDFTVVVQYTKGSSLFSKDYQPITKMIHMTYMKNKVDDSTKKYTASFYGPKDVLIEKKEYYVGQIPVSPGDMSFAYLVVGTPYKMVNWVKPWQEELKAIYADTKYHLDVMASYKNISYYGIIYDKETGKYKYGLIAIIPSLCGELPTPPKEKDMVVEPGWKLDGWSPSLREAETDYSYSATYRQDPDYSFCSFYVDGACISKAFVKKGDTPVAPDMSSYKSDERVFFGWSPSVGPVNSSSQTYQAYFRKYVTVTFKDRDGRVVSEERILAGELPTAPSVPDMIKGEESYYEYHFSKWATDKGIVLGQVYEDTVFKAIYKTTYLPVTTVFDAGEHSFADGTKTMTFVGTYAPYNFLYLPKASFSDQGKTYEVDYWQSTEMVNGSYVKLYMKGRYTEYKYNLTFQPVYAEGVPITYTVRFDGGDKPITLTGLYGDIITADMLKDLTKNPPSENYKSVLTDYGLKLPYSFGSTMGPDGEPATYISVVVRFEFVGVDKTYTFDANGGEFADGEDIKKLTAPYATNCSFVLLPEKKEDVQYTYDFLGWADTKDATTGTDYDDFVITRDRTVYAIYAKTAKEYTVTFNSNGGEFPDGETIKTVTAAYNAPCSFDDEPGIAADDWYSYVFIGWAETADAVTGERFTSFVMTGNRTLYAVYTKTLREYTVTFNANGGQFTDGETMKAVSAAYNTPCSFNEDPRKEADIQYTYEFIGWADKADAVTGESFDDFIMTGNRTMYAIFEKTIRDYTVTFDANEGFFTDNTNQKTITANYNTRCSFVEVPEKTGGEEYTYEFIGWADTADATSGMSFSDFIMTGNRTVYAVYTESSIDYRISFDLNGGNIGGVSSTVVQAVQLGDTIVPPADPEKPKDATNRYVFIGWTPTLPEGATVTETITYVAEYRSIRIDGVLEETGIVVTDGTLYEDICVNSISGYSYQIIDSNPVLMISGNGLTFSGEGDARIVAQTTLTDLSLEDLTVTNDRDGVVINSEVATGVLNIQISGNCFIHSTHTESGTGARFERPVILSGAGAGAKLTIDADHGSALYCADDFDVNALELVINASGGAIDNDEGEGEEWRFSNSVIRLNGTGPGIFTLHSIAIVDSELTIDSAEGISCEDLLISGSSTIHVTTRGESAAAIEVEDLTLADFTGQFFAESVHATSPGIAVYSYGEILFMESGAVVSPDLYDLGGAQISDFDGGSYRSFGILVELTLVPAAVVSVTAR